MKENQRPSTGYIRTKPSYRSINAEDLRTINNKEEELWSLLKYHANVEAVTLDLIKSKGPKWKHFAYSKFQAHIHQARTYYDSARRLHHQSASLNYYYCFMNLARAAIALNKPSQYRSEYYHGLARSGIQNNLFSRSSKVQTDVRKSKTRPNQYPVFSQLYELEYDMTLPRNSELQLGNLIRYCSEAAYQNQIVSREVPKQLPAYFLIMADTTKAPLEFWPVVGLYGAAELQSYPEFNLSFLNVFEQVSVNQQNAARMLGIEVKEVSHVSFFQSKEVRRETKGKDYVEDALEILKTAIGPHFEPVRYDDPCDFYLTLPISKSLNQPMKEYLAVYVIMHHLSELVRYHPDQVASMLHSKESWVLESIIDTSAAMFLRGITALILGTDYHLSSR